MPKSKTLKKKEAGPKDEKLAEKKPEDEKKEESSSSSSESESETENIAKDEKTQNDKKPKKSKKKKNVEADDDGSKEETRIQEKSKPDTESITPSKLLDLLANINIILSDVKLKYIDVSPFQLTSLLARNEMSFVEIKEVRSRYNVWLDEPNKIRYFINNTRSNAKALTLIELIDDIISNLSSMRSESLTFMYEPSKITILNRPCINPSALGFDVARLFIDSTYTDELKRIVQDACTPNAVNGVLHVQSLEDIRVSRCRERLIQYARNDMPNIIQDWNQMLNIYSLSRNVVTERLNPLRLGLFPKPFAPHNLIFSPFDDFTTGSIFRIEFISFLANPDIILQPIAADDIAKAYNQNATRMSFISAFSNIDYNVEMASELSLYFSSLLNPGDILFDIDFESYNPANIEVKGFVAMLAKCIFMFDSNSVFSNITREGMTEIDKQIIALLDSKNMLRLFDEQAPFPLDRYRLRRDIPEPGLERLQSQGTRNGMNYSTNPILAANDRMHEFYPNVGPRFNYALDADNFSEFNSDYHDAWELSRAIGSILSSANLGGYGTVARIILRKVMRFFVRMNEYLSVHWYTIFRMRWQKQAMSVYDEYQTTAVRRTMNFNTLMYLIKSLPDEEINPSRTWKDRLRFESTFCYELEIARTNLRTIESLRNIINFNTDFGPKQLLQRICSEGVTKYMLDVVQSCAEEQVLMDLINNRPFERPFLHLFDDLVAVNPNSLIRDGKIVGVVYHQVLNRCSRNFLIDIIQRGSFLDNFIELQPDALRVDYVDLFQRILQNSFKETLFSSSVIMTFLHHVFCYEYNHDHDKMGEDAPLKWKITGRAMKPREDITFEKVKVSLVSIFQEKYKFPDDYVPRSHVVESVHISNANYPQLLINVEDALRDLQAHTSIISVFPSDSMGFSPV